MQEPQTDLKVAERFLRWAYPNGPWVLTAIPVEGGRTLTETFYDMNAARGWIGQQSGRMNVYWTVNLVKSPTDKKPKKEDIEEAHFLHVDLDPRKGEDVDKERKRILELLQDFSPSPSVIVDSGGGYQGFWRLDDPLFIGGDANRIADLEAYNRQLSIVLRGDSTHNIDRIMRLPGSINLPDEKKIKKGRIKRLATIVELSELTYPLMDFVAAPEVQSNGSSGVKVQISGNLPRLKDLDELPEAITQRTRMLIVQGDDPDDPTRYSSRSEAMWAVLCELIRGGCEDDMIAAVLLDPDFGISDHPLRQKRSVEYVARQIERAREEVIEPMLRVLNAKHAVIADLGGKCRIISEVLDLHLIRPRTRISMQSFEDFRNRYMNQRVQIGLKDGIPQYMSAGKWWLLHPMRRQYDSMVFAPGREVTGAYNLWQGFACEAIPGDQHQPFLDHLKENTCSGNEEHYHYLVNWMARAVQFPGQPGQVAIILRGRKGAGKGTVPQIFGSLWGRHFLHISSAKHLVGQFNAHLRDCIVLFADEAFFAGDKAHESTLKALVTEETLVVEKKGVDAEPGPNYTHIMMASNDTWVVPAGEDERRYFVLDVGEKKKQNFGYFRDLNRAMDEGGREALLHYLMTLDISEYEVRSVPQTQALQEQKILTLNAEEQWWLERLMDGKAFAGATGWLPDVQKDAIQRDYLRYAEEQRIFRRVSPTVLGTFLKKQLHTVGGKHKWPRGIQKWTDVEEVDVRGQVRWVNRRVYYYEMPALEECRAAWDQNYGGPYDWPDTEEQEPGTEQRAMLDQPY